VRSSEKGFGDLPDYLAWSRPFAVTGAIVEEMPVETNSQVQTLHWGFSIQYSTNDDDHGGDAA
jgi:hypothetical protein